MCQIGGSKYKKEKKSFYEIDCFECLINSHFGGLFPSLPASGWQPSASPVSDRDHFLAVASSSEGHGLPPQPGPIKQLCIKIQFILNKDFSRKWKSTTISIFFRLRKDPPRVHTLCLSY